MQATSSTLDLPPCLQSDNLVNTTEVHWLSAVVFVLPLCRLDRVTGVLAASQGMSHTQCLGGRLGRCPAAADLSSKQQLPHRWRAAPVPRHARSQRSRQHVSAQQFDFSLPDTGLYMPPDPAERLVGRETDPEFGLTVKQMAALGLGSQHRPLTGSEPEPVRMYASGTP